MYRTQMINALRRMESIDVVRIGKTAIHRGDHALAKTCLAVVEPRNPRKAVRAEILDLRKSLVGSVCGDGSVRQSRDRPNPKASGKHFSRASRREHRDVLGLVTDQDIGPLREQMIRKATRSIWISSLTPPSARISELLRKQAEEDVAVVLIIAERTIKRWDQEERLARLERAGVDCNFLRSTHSKCLVIDEEYVLIGSANAGRVHRDLCFAVKNRGLALEVIDYLDWLRR